MKIPVRSLFVLLIGAVCGSACGPSNTPVAPLPQTTQDQVNQNLNNNHLPQPGEVGSGTVPPADDACLKFQNALPASWQKGMITVPEDPAQPAGNQLHVFYYGKLNPNSVPTIYFNGGPGADSRGDYSVLTRRQPVFDPASHISFVFMDQRGNGCSDFYPQGRDAATLQRLAHYGSRGIVADAEAVRKVLWGDRPWIAAGQSYGGFVVHRYVSLFPKSLKAAFSQEDVLTSDGYSKIKDRVASQARVTALYFAQYPDDEKRVQDLRDYLTPSRCYSNVDSSEKSCGFRVLLPLVSSLLGFSDQWLTIHDWIGLMDPASGPSDPGIARFLATFVFGRSNPLNIKSWANDVIGWTDRNSPPLDAYRCLKIQADLAASGVDLSKVLLHECMGSLQSPAPNPTDSFAWIEGMPQDLETLSSFTDALGSNPSLAFFLYSAERDVYVPVQDFSEELAAVQTLGNVHYTNFSGSGHDASYDEPQSWSDMIAASTP